MVATVSHMQALWIRNLASWYVAMDATTGSRRGLIPRSEAYVPLASHNENDGIARSHPGNVSALVDLLPIEKRLITLRRRELLLGMCGTWESLMPRQPFSCVTNPRQSCKINAGPLQSRCQST